MDTITAKELAVLAGTTPKRMRSFIRALDERGSTIVSPVGIGNRYAFSRDEAHALIAAFKASRNVAAGVPARSAEALVAWLADDDDLVADDVDGVSDDDDDDGTNA